MSQYCHLMNWYSPTSIFLGHKNNLSVNYFCFSYELYRPEVTLISSSICFLVQIFLTTILHLLFFKIDLSVLIWKHDYSHKHASCLYVDVAKLSKHFTSGKDIGMKKKFWVKKTLNWIINYWFQTRWIVWN